MPFVDQNAQNAHTSECLRLQMPEASRYEIQPVDADDTWDCFVAQATGGNLFVHAAWLQCTELAGAGEPIIRGVYDKGTLVAAVVGVRTQGQVKRLATPPLLPHSGFLFRQPLSDQLPRQEAERNACWQALLPDLATYQHVHLSCAPAVFDMREALWAKWQVHPRYTYLIDLSEDRQVLWDGLERRTRTVIRKAETAGFRVEPANAEGFAELYRLTYGHTKPPVDADVTQRFVAAAVEQGLVEGYRAVTASGETAATVFFATDATQARLYAWVAGADPSYRNSGASALLYWKVLEATQAKSFDFVGANMASIALFKRGFGGRLVSYYALEKWNSPWRRWAAALRG
jgi:hypothetical protein